MIKTLVTRRDDSSPPLPLLFNQISNLLGVLIIGSMTKILPGYFISHAGLNIEDPLVDGHISI